MGGSGSQNVYVRETKIEGGLGGVSVEEEKCEDIYFETNLVSPQIDILEEYSEKDRFSLTESDGKLILVTEDGTAIGTILHKKVVEIMECKKNDYEFEGQIISIDDAKVQVLIYCL